MLLEGLWGICLTPVLTIIGALLLIIVLFVGIYSIIYLIGRSYDPKSIKKKFDYSTFDHNKFLVNMVMEDCVRALQHNRFDLKEVNINGYQSLSLHKKEAVYNFARDSPFKDYPLMRPRDRDVKMDLFIIFCERERITKKDIIEFSDLCCSYSIKTRKGLPRGFNSGSMSLSILMSENVKVEAIEHVLERPPQHFAAMELPVIYDLSSNTYHHYVNDKMWGKGIYPFVYSLLGFLFGKNIPRHK